MDTEISAKPIDPQQPQSQLQSEILQPSQSSPTGQEQSQQSPAVECGRLYKHNRLFENSGGGKLHIDCTQTLTGRYVYVRVDGVKITRSPLYFPLCEAIVY